jgi:hypothetical protein
MQKDVVIAESMSRARGYVRVFVVKEVSSLKRWVTSLGVPVSLWTIQALGDIKMKMWTRVTSIEDK